MTHGSNADFPEVQKAIETSAAGRILIASFARIENSARCSAVLKFLRAKADRYREVHRAQRIAAIGVVMISFAVTYLLLALLVPSRSAPAIPALIWAPMACLGVLLLALSDKLATWCSDPDGKSGS